MTRDIFNQRKIDVLSKVDKSSKQSWDEKITGLCEKINLLKNYYTTSSCSGRVVLMVDQEKKEEGLFVKVYHDLISFEELKKDLEKAVKKKSQIKFKQDPCILHIACRSLEDAQKIYELGKLAGWKRSGIVVARKIFLVELNSTEKLEFPIINNKKILVDDEFLNVVIKEANMKLKKIWEKIDKLVELVERKSL